MDEAPKVFECLKIQVFTGFTIYDFLKDSVFIRDKIFHLIFGQFSI